nr:Ig-like domain-containing protein [Clostridium algidicarnis]
MMQKIKETIPTKKLLPNISIDLPKEEAKYFDEKVIPISGWVINENEIKSINIYVDDKFIQEAEYGLATPELKKTYPEYANTENCGYRANVDISNLSYGKHSIKVESVDSSNNKISEIKSFEKLYLPIRMSIDNPNDKQVISKSKFNVSGWATSNKNIKAVNIYLDDKFMGSATYGLFRPDVKNVFPNYPSGDNPGYIFELDTKLIQPGNHVVKVESIDESNIRTFEEKHIEIKKLEGTTTLEINLEDNVYGLKPLEIKGLALNQSDIKQVEVFLNNSLLGNAKHGLQSEEALKAFPDYTNAANAGYEYLIDNSKLKEGRNVIKVVSKGNDGTSKEVIKEIDIAKADNLMVLDNPGEIVGNSNIIVSGWALNKSGIKKVEVYLDGKLVDNATINLSRPDVLNVFKGYVGADKSGYSLKINKEISEGSHMISVKSYANNGETLIITKKINTIKLYNDMAMDVPVAGEKVNSEIIVKGWALNTSGIKQVKILVDGIYAGDAEYGLSRPDVKNAFPAHTNSSESGYSLNVSIDKFKAGEHIVTAEAVGMDGSSTKTSKKIKVEKLDPISNIDFPMDKSVQKEKLTISGWTLNDSGISKVKVFVDGNYIGDAKHSLGRPDVKGAFPKYKYATTSGYSLDYDSSKLSIGKHEVKTESIGNDGSIKVETKSFEIFKGQLMAEIDSPSGNKRGTTIDLNGWVVSPSEIKSVEVYLDNKLLGNANYGTKRPDVMAIFPGYPVGENCGFNYQVSTKDLNIGNHEIKIIVTDAKNNKIEKNKDFKFVKLPSDMALDVDFKNNDNLYGKNTLMLKGWALSDSGIKEVRINVDGVFRGNPTMGKIRPDVQNAFRDYSNSLFSGYEYELKDIDKLAQGFHNILVTSISNDGTVDSRTINFIIKQNRIVVVDPGHNHGGDYGAVSNIGGIRYSETDLNMQVSMKLKESLENEGYTVYLTRGPLDLLYDNLNTSIANRYTIANNLNAEAFISIHHDSSSDSNAKGVSTFYSSFKPGLDNVDIVKGVDPNGYGWYDFQMDLTPTQEAIKGRELARNIVNGVSSNMGYYNRREHDRGLGVTRETNMPAVLVECGFISNLEDARRASNPNNQKELANNIAREVKRTLK